jgi:hypothetical protein
MQYTLIHKSSEVQISKELLLLLHYKTAEHIFTIMLNTECDL